MCGCIFKIFAKRQYALIFTPISVINVWISYGARKPVRNTKSSPWLLLNDLIPLIVS